MHGRRPALTPRIVWFLALLLSLAGFVLFGRPAAGDCGTHEDVVPIARLAGLQGEPPADGTPVVIDGTVTGVFPGRDGLNGFFIQHSDDAGPAGIFVYAPGFTAADWQVVRPGARLRLEGLTGTWRGQPQVHRVHAVHECGDGDLPAASELRLPADQERLQALRGTLVSLPQTLTVTGNYTLGRFGALKLSAGGRLFRGRVPEDGRLHRLILDDGSYAINPEPVPYLDTSGTRRSGDKVRGLSGVLAHAFDDWRIHPLRPPAFENANPRREAPDRPEGLLLATFNLENYFISLGERGAGDREGLERQRSKLLSALRRLDADLLALVEVENRREALADLLHHLNNELPEAKRYSMLEGPRDTGSDAIKVALLYRPANLEALGSGHSDVDPIHNRPPAIAAFRDRGNGRSLLVAAVHFKSKTGCPESGDTDRGQGCWNLRRTAQAEALVRSVDYRARQLGIEAIALAGDFNSYAHEDPVGVLAKAGYVDLVSERMPEDRRYSYVFRGEAGTLDYLFVNAVLDQRVTGVEIWHINADEPAFLGYDQRGAESEASLGQPWRSSDHDPVMMGIDRGR